ncbi:CmpA/NrtA family ABC transporter substrate-binding protein [Granulosicoccaceae sp. 1_MG-2023]|nr:CmpA/NrtA family ABC transporter substrate-binding protein [Granulosicoccaceae sp. 1_MG-2023]
MSDPEVLSPEKRTLTFGYVPLIDSAALAVAREKGFFAAEGLDVTLCAEPSWANIRDKVACGLFDGAQMLAGMPLAASLGVGPVHEPMVTSFGMSLNGNAVTVSNALYAALAAELGVAEVSPARAGEAMRALVGKRRAAGLAPLTLAHVYNFSAHNYQLRYWLAANGINPETDVRLVVVPPQRMRCALADGEIDGYCVGEPWNTLAAATGQGRILLNGYDIWRDAPEKVFGVTRRWADDKPGTHRAVLRALTRASQWLGQDGNLPEAASLLSEHDYIPLGQAQLLAAMQGGPGGRHGRCTFFSHQANTPFLSHAVWFITQMYRWGQLSEVLPIAAAAAAVYRPALFHDVARELGLQLPQETTQRDCPERFIDGRQFDVQAPVDYLREAPLSHLRVDLGALEAAQ